MEVTNGMCHSSQASVLSSNRRSAQPTFAAASVLEAQAAASYGRMRRSSRTAVIAERDQSGLLVTSDAQANSPRRVIISQGEQREAHGEQLQRVAAARENVAGAAGVLDAVPGDKFAAALATAQRLARVQHDAQEQLKQRHDNQKQHQKPKQQQQQQ